MASVMERAKEEFAAKVTRAGLTDAPIAVGSSAASAGETNDMARYDDLPILRGKEVLIEAEFQGARGQAFTNQAGAWEGTVGELLSLPLTSNRGRATLLAAMNAVMRHLGEVDRTVYCTEAEANLCGKETAAMLREEFGEITVGLVGYQPGLAAGLAAEFGPERLRITDLALENIGRVVQGVEVWDGWNSTAKLVSGSDVVLAAGSTIVNATYEQLTHCTACRGIPLILYGVTAASVCRLCGIRRICPRAA